VKIKYTLPIFFLFWCAIPIAAPASDWKQIIRDTPYSFSKGASKNLAELRRWVLLSNGYCELPDRHVFFDQRGQFLTWMDNEDTSEATQVKLNKIRLQLHGNKKVNRWIEGSDSTMGYPFALSCDQPWVDIDASINRVKGKTPKSKVWGTWDGVKAGTESKPISLEALVGLMFQHRHSQLSVSLNTLSLRLFVAQLIIESGAKKYVRSSDNALGMLQLKPEVLNDCGIDKRFYQHRMAQVDCAVRLYVMLSRNLQPVFSMVFGHLEKAKQQALFDILLVQSYHSGIGAMTTLLTDSEMGKAARYFAEHEQQFSAEDIATGMIFHNLGRQPWGWESLYYVLDIMIVSKSLSAHDS
jgi:hypothetical protein